MPAESSKYRVCPVNVRGATLPVGCVLAHEHRNAAIIVIVSEMMDLVMVLRGWANVV
jgi:hypothetical protein